MIKSKMSGGQYFLFVCYGYLYSNFIYFSLILPITTKDNQIELTRLFLSSIILLSFPPTPFLLFFYYNSLIQIDTENKLIRVRKLFWKYKTIQMNGNERYIVRRIRGRINFTFIYLINDEKVLFTYQNIFNSNWDELEEGLNNMGINEVSYDGMILFRDLFKMRI